MDEYGYDVADMAVEFSIKMGTQRKRADIVVFKPGGSRRQDTVVVIVEAKREGVSPKDKAEGVDQLKSYMSACSSCRFGLWVGSEKLAYEKSEAGELDDTTDIPRFGDAQPQPPRFHELTPATDLKASLRRCHNYIYVNQGFQKAEAFHELQKLIFCKVLDENELVDQLRFFVRGEERKSIAGQRRLRDERIAPLFEEVKERYPYIFEPEDRIKLNLKVLAYIVLELQRYSLINTQADVKGQAYEELVGANLRGDRDEFFTPRNVCDMTVRMVLSLHSNRKIASLKVLDCCCGTGGSLVAVVNQLRQKVAGFEQARVAHQRMSDTASVQCHAERRYGDRRVGMTSWRRSWTTTRADPCHGHNLVQALWTERDACLRFLAAPRVLSTNNWVERALCMAKLQMKIAGSFRPRASGGPHQGT